MKRYMLFALLIVLASSTFAGDRDFTYIYQSATEEKHEHELEIWFTYLDGGKSLNNFLSHRAEFEIGLTDRLQTSFYLNLDYNAHEGLSMIGIDPQLGTALYEPAIQKDLSMSFSNEWKFKMSDMESNAIGSALYGEFTIGPDKTEWEGKLILDKKIGNLILALNATEELEYNSSFEVDADNPLSSPVVHEKESVAELSFGASYDFSEQFSLGVELFGTNEFAEDAENELSINAGPVAVYRADEWWIALTAMPNWYTSELNAETQGRPIQSRLMFSYEF